MCFNERLKQLRTDKAITIKEVASALGMTVSAYAHYEQGRREPSLDVLCKICNYYDVSADYLIGRTDGY
jgi:transcriptional regulator with XRE-family HTH domain